jgi:predicted Fe-Mo cluster-binding NifX family protein
MKIVVTAQGRDLTSEVDPRFGRAKYFIVVDVETGEFTAEDREGGTSSLQGAGIQAGRRVVELGVDSVVTGHVGPKAFSTLQAGGVRVFVGATGSVNDAISQFKAGKLECVSGPDVAGHWA